MNIFLFSIGIICSEDYKISTCGLFRHYCGDESVSGPFSLQNMAIQNTKEESQKTTGKFFYLNRDNTVVSSIVDYDAVRNIFLSESDERRNTLANINYNFLYYTNCTNKLNLNNYVSFIKEDDWCLILCKNSREVLRDLIGNGVLECTKGFASSLQKEILRFKIEDVNLNRFGRLEYFESLQKLYDSCKEFFLNEKLYINDVFDTFMKFFETKVCSSKNINGMKREDLVKALDCLKDFSRLCEYLRKPDEKYKYNMLTCYKYSNEQKIFVYKALEISFSKAMYFYAHENTLQLLTKDKKVLKRSFVKIRNDSIIIRLFDLSQQPVHYVKVRDGSKDILIDISEYNPLLNKSFL
ncbi:hypothetical protein NGRA_1825 [Nosema granulosis]|uniref:Uncharacterized protein n=1 Tax=Nosema granulosis TaxID=83296 RepID=A0A9P6GXS7_9MICR|nr:hypothetical protein NGRA_1825 [Nosema granulosis]